MANYFIKMIFIQILLQYDVRLAEGQKADGPPSQVSHVPLAVCNIADHSFKSTRKSTMISCHQASAKLPFRQSRRKAACTISKGCQHRA